MIFINVIINKKKPYDHNNVLLKSMIHNDFFPSIFHLLVWIQKKNETKVINENQVNERNP